MKNWPIALVLMTLGACTAAPPPAPPTPPTEAAPPALAISESRPIEDTHRRTFGFSEAGVWISNEFEGGKVNDAWQEGDSEFVVQLRPENFPINSSAWYAFKIWSRERRSIEVSLTYENGRHRYWPKVRGVEEPWMAVDSADFSFDRDTRQATLQLDVGPDTLWVAGQEMMTSSFFRAWTDSLAREDYIEKTIAGTSGQGRPMPMVEFGNPEATRHVMVIGRQHPPEATGTMALLAFVEELAGDSPLAREFREDFRVHVIPLVNPDGVDLGHWRHNTGGVDLNRDWVAFNQPETRVVRDTFTGILDAPGHRLWFGVDFHSTQQDVFYTLNRSLETEPAGVTDKWLDYIGTHLPHYQVNDSPPASGATASGSPISRSWFHETFGAPALIYEVGDQTDRGLIREVASTAARGTMEILLGELGGR